ncbi:ParB N-terminal domain-containing protein [Bariatricus massiliensis]|uniref:ParB N-terminal domain-containing protein n=1 Tax=Bariatricus massiliensis TaxID=1745713 RepID=UPI00082C6619|nr:ParB N-terminal domain-containing protein [Bariatricus massiliensis]
MKYKNIANKALINNVDEEKVNAIAESMRKNGFVGCPILIWNDELMTGSHRMAALKKLEDEGVDIFDWEVAEDITEIAEENFSKFEEENGWQRDVDFSDIGWLLKGSWVEEYKDEIVEW